MRGQLGFNSDRGSQSHLSVHPVTQGNHSGGFGGRDATLLERRDAAAEVLQSGQTLLIPLHRRLISLRLKRKCMRGVRSYLFLDYEQKRIISRI